MMTSRERHPRALFRTFPRTSSGSSTAAVTSPASPSSSTPPIVRLRGRSRTAVLVKVLTLVAWLSISVALIAGLAGGFSSPLSLSVFAVSALLVLLSTWMTVKSSRARSSGPTKDDLRRAAAVQEYMERCARISHPLPPVL